MAEFINRDLRLNETTEQLSSLLGDARKRAPAVTVQRPFTTTPKGEVLDRFGNLVYTPTPLKSEKK